MIEDLFNLILYPTLMKLLIQSIKKYKTSSCNNPNPAPNAKKYPKISSCSHVATIFASIALPSDSVSKWKKENRLK